MIITLLYVDAEEDNGVARVLRRLIEGSETIPDSFLEGSKGRR